MRRVEWEKEEREFFRGVFKGFLILLEDFWGREEMEFLMGVGRDFCEERRAKQARDGRGELGKMLLVS